MAKAVNELIRYYGIDDCAYNNIFNFKQFNINTILYVPIERPDINQITKVWLDYNIINYELVKTPVGTSCELQNLTGNKVFVSADLIIKIEYIADDINNSIHSMCTKIPICTYVTLEENFIGSHLISPSISIEDVYCEKLGYTEFYINIILMAVADIC